MVVRLFDEKKIVSELVEDSISLVHGTRKVDAMKLAITVYDLLALNLRLVDQYQELSRAFNEVGQFAFWDKASLKELNYSRCALVLYYRADFNPMALLDQFNVKAARFIHLAQLSFSKPT